MAEWEPIADSLWQALAAVETEQANAEAETSCQIAFVGAPGSGKTALGCALAALPPQETVPDRLLPFLAEFRLPPSAEDVKQLESANLLILLLDATKGDFVNEVAAADYLSYLGRPMLVCYSKMDLVPIETRLIHGQARWRGAEIMPLAAVDADTVADLLVPAVLEALPEHALTLARHLPLFRSVVVDRMIERSARVNAAYASATGLADAVPLKRMPLRSEDIQVLCANQAALIHRLGLAHGRALDWHQDHAAVQSAVDMSAVWRLLARRVVGLIPLWALNTKVSLAYAGTVAAGRAMVSWLERGEPLSDAELQSLCRQVAVQSRETSDDVAAKARDALPAPAARPTGLGRLRERLGRTKSSTKQARPRCPMCGRLNPAGAAFCAYCGTPFGETLGQDSGETT